MSKDKSEKTTGETVTVACKMPNGIVLRVFEMVPDREPILGGGWRETKTAHQIGQSVTLNGNAIPVGIPTDRVIESGYALTRGVSKEFWDLWKEQNKDSDLMRNRIVFAYGDDESVKDFAKENRTVKSGLEPLSLDGKGQLDDARTRGGRARIQTADEQKTVAA